MKIFEGLTYDDVLLIPQRSFIDHRSDVSTKTKLTRNIEMYLPFISANMDTVTKSQMAIVMAKEGGIGIIHRFMTIEEEVEEVRLVKRHEGFVLTNPYKVFPETALAKIWVLVKKYQVAGFLVVNRKNKLLGILSHRDYVQESDQTKRASELMTPLKKLITGKSGITFPEAKNFFKKHRVEKLPLINKTGGVQGLITARSILNYEKYPYSTKDKYGRYRVGAAVGVTSDFLDRAKALVKAEVDVLVIDVAHGHNEIALKALSAIRKMFKDIEIIAGNVATKEGASDLIKRGADAIKVGIGPGGLCTTRVVTGVGYPQFSAVLECARVARRKKIPVIADGGTNYPGDITKALAAGASSVMLAGWFAGTDESPGGIIVRNGQKYKVHRGSASFLATADRKLKLENGQVNSLNKIVPEGVEALVPYKGKVADVIYQLQGALRSGMSYCNAKTIADLQKNAKFIKITEAGFRESRAHNIEEI